LAFGAGLLLLLIVRVGGCGARARRLSGDRHYRDQAK
jgi:hypothetical protein